MATFVLVHGGWGGGWEWRAVAEGLQDRGHVAYRPTLTGMGERRHLARPDVDLETHIADVLGLVECEGLDDVVLCGQSYGGAVVTGVADRAADRVRRLVYVEGFALRDGESVLTHTPPDLAARVRELAASEGAGWEVPVPFTGDELGLPADLAERYMPKLLPQPLASLEQPLRLTGALDRVPKSYIACSPAGKDDLFAPFADRAQAEGWEYRELRVGHDPQLIAPDRLVDLLAELAA